MEKQCKEEREILDKIKKKMDRIRDRHNKERNRRSRALEEQSPDQEPAELPQQIYQEPTDHYEGLTYRWYIANRYYIEYIIFNKKVPWKCSGLIMPMATFPINFNGFLYPSSP